MKKKPKKGWASKVRKGLERRHRIFKGQKFRGGWDERPMVLPGTPEQFGKNNS